MDGRKRFVSMEEHRRLSVVGEMIAGTLSEKEGARLLRLSVRQVRRIKTRILEQGSQGVVHQGRGKASNRRLPEAIRRRVRELYESDFQGWNMCHFTETLEREYALRVSPETARGIPREHSARPRGRGRPGHRRWRERRGHEGELLQMDSSIHPWFAGSEETFPLITMIDDATGTCPGMRFFASDGTLENLKLVRDVVERRGVFAELYADGASHFFLDEQSLFRARERGEEGLTRFGEIMKALGVHMIRARGPQAKGRVERLFGTIQDRLLKELAREGIRDIEEANRYLGEAFLSRFNRRFGCAAREETVMYVPMARDFDYDALFCLEESRVIRGDSTISWQGKTLQLYETKGRQPRKGRKVQVRTYTDRILHVFLGGTELLYKECAKSG